MEWIEYSLVIIGIRIGMHHSNAIFINDLDDKIWQRQQESLFQILNAMLDNLNRILFIQAIPVVPIHHRQTKVRGIAVASILDFLHGRIMINIK